MRRATAWIVVVGVACLGTAAPASAADGFWVSIASGVAGSSSPTAYQDLWFETPHGPPPVAVTQVSGATVEATTGGGSSFFNSGAVPVVLPTTDGYAYLAGNKPSDLSSALKRQTSGGQGLATASPDATASAPPDGALRLTANLAEPGADGSRTLTVGLTDGLLNPIGSGSLTVNVPDGGWWVVGLGPGAKDTTTTPPDGGTGGGDPDGGNTGGGNTGGGNTGGGNTGGGNTGGGDAGGGGPVATPEPATGMLLGIGGLSAAGWRLVKRRRGK